MHRLALLLWIMVAPVIMGVLVTVTLVVPYFVNEQHFWIPIAAVSGAVIALPISYLVAKSLKNFQK